MSNDQTTPNPAKTSTPSKGAPQELARSTASATDRNQLLVRASSSPDDPVRDGVQLGIIAFTTAAALIGLLVIGAVAERVGIDPWLGTGALMRPIGETFVTGAELPIVMLRSLYGSGVVDPLFFAAALALAIPPIAGLVAARPRKRGAERPAPAVAAASGLTAALVVGADILIGVRASSQTSSTLSEAIGDPGWADSLRDTAASDCVAMILAILLAILVLRLPTERWVRGVCGTIAIATAVTAVGLAAASAGVVTMIQRDHPMVKTAAPESKEVLLLGTRTDGRTVGLKWSELQLQENETSDQATIVILAPDASDHTVTDSRSIASVIDSMTP